MEGNFGKPDIKTACKKMVFGITSWVFGQPGIGSSLEMVIRVTTLDSGGNFALAHFLVEGSWEDLWRGRSGVGNHGGMDLFWWDRSS